MTLAPTAATPDRFADPLTPEGCDLTDFEFMPLSVTKLRKSKAWLMCKRKPNLAFYMINLWTAAWHEVPAASLEDNDDVLADLAMCADLDRWAEIKEDVMHGFQMCADGRLYHPVVAEKALEAWLEKLAHRISSGHGNAKRWSTSFDPAPLVDQMEVARACLFLLNPMSKAFSKKHASIRKPVTEAAPPPPDKKPKAPKAATPASVKPVDNTGDSADSPDGIASKGTGTVKGQGQGNKDSADAPLSDKTKAPTLADVELPDWMPMPQWNDFLAMRQSMGKSIPFTVAAARGIVRKLTQLRELGDDPVAVLEKSVRNGWRDVFSIVGDRGGKQRVGGPLSDKGTATLANARSLEGKLFRDAP